MHVFLRHLEEILPCQLSHFVLFYCPVQVSLIPLIATAVGDHPPATFMLTG
jgi:hypothetical protein